MLKPIEPSAISSLDDWRRIGAALERAVARNPLYTMRSVFDDLIAGRTQLWLFGESVAVTSIDSYPASRVLTVWWAAGKLSEIKTCVPDAVAWGRARGCAFIEIPHARRGWARVLGLSETAVRLRGAL